jgi:hypothetical protein
VSPIFTSEISDPCSDRLLFRTRKEVTRATDAFLERLRSQLTKQENEVLDKTVLAEVANKKTNWKKLRGTSRMFLIDKFRNITGHEPADDMNAGDLSAIIAEDKFGRYYFGGDFDGPSQRAPRPIPESMHTDTLLSGGEWYQGLNSQSRALVRDEGISRYGGRRRPRISCSAASCARIKIAGIRD